jgi:hypothetical protein
MSGAPTGAGGPGRGPSTYTVGPEVAVWEAHITDLIRRDDRWHQLWATFLRWCVVPEDTEKFPGHSSQRSTRQGRVYQEEFKHCMEEPRFHDKMSE